MSNTRYTNRSVMEYADRQRHNPVLRRFKGSPVTTPVKPTPGLAVPMALATYSSPELPGCGRSRQALMTMRQAPSSLYGTARAPQLSTKDP